MKEINISARIRAEGEVVEILDDGSESTFAKKSMRPMSDEEIEAAARADADARPMTEEKMQRSRRAPRVKTLRRALGLTQEEFASKYQIPLGTLRDWEQGRSTPDQPAKSYPRAIAGDPEAVSGARFGTRIPRLKSLVRMRAVCGISK